MSVSVIKKINKLNGLTEKQLQDLHTDAYALYMKSGIMFNILKGDSDLVIKASQEKIVDKRLTKKEIIELTQQTFGEYFPAKKIKVQPHEIKLSPRDQVTAEWIRSQMEAYDINLKQLSQETGLHASQLSMIINERDGLSAPMKAMFFFYFKCKNLEQ
jgi:hypothetical protein